MALFERRNKNENLDSGDWDTGERGGYGMDSYYDDSPERYVSDRLRSTMRGGYTKQSAEDVIAALQENARVVKLQLEQQIKDISAEKVVLIRECEVLRQQLQESETKLSETRQQLASLQEKDEEEPQGSSFDGEIHNEIRRLQTMVKDYEKMRRSGENYELLIEEKEQYISELSDEMESYKDEIEALTNRIEELEADLRSAQEKGGSSFNKEKLNSEIAAKQAEFDKILQELEEKTNNRKKKLHALIKNFPTEKRLSLHLKIY